MNKKISVYPEKCTACPLCELGCSFKKIGEFNPTASRVRVSIFGEDAFYAPIVCTQCDEAWCLKACPSGAISRDHGARVVKVDRERCVGCRMCTLACPFGTITYYAPEGKSINLSSTVSDPGVADTFTYAWSVTKNGASFASGSSSSFSFTPDDNGSYEISLNVMDDDGGTGSNDGLDIGFNVTYLLEVLANLKCEQVCFALGEALGSALITMPDSEKFKYVVMPMRI